MVKKKWIRNKAHLSSVNGCWVFVYTHTLCFIYIFISFTIFFSLNIIGEDAKIYTYSHFLSLAKIKNKYNSILQKKN